MSRVNRVYELIEKMRNATESNMESLKCELVTIIQSAQAAQLRADLLERKGQHPRLYLNTAAALLADAILHNSKFKRVFLEVINLLRKKVPLDSAEASGESSESKPLILLYDCANEAPLPVIPRQPENIALGVVLPVAAPAVSSISPDRLLLIGEIESKIKRLGPAPSFFAGTHNSKVFALNRCLAALRDCITPSQFLHQQLIFELGSAAAAGYNSCKPWGTSEVDGIVERVKLNLLLPIAQPVSVLNSSCAPGAQ